jgi:hypothetical protein
MKKVLLTLSAVLMIGVTASAYSTVSAVSVEEPSTLEYKDETSLVDSDYYDDYTYYESDSDYDRDMSDEEIATFIGVFVVYGTIILIVLIPLYIYNGFAQTAIAKKLQHENPVWAWIPVMNLIQIFQMAELSPWLILLLLIPILGAFALLGFMIYAYWKIAEKLEFPGWIALFILINPLNLVVLGILAWGNPDMFKSSAKE